MNRVFLTALVLTGVCGSAFANGNSVLGTGNTISANSTSSMVSGFQNSIDANNAFAFGTNNTVTGENGFAGGNNATAAGRNSFAFGSHAESLVEYTIAIGNQARTASYDSVAIGNGAFVSGESSVALGRTNNVTGENTVVVGANNGTVATGQGVVIGYNNKVGTDKEQLNIGSNNTTNGQGAITLGTHAQTLAWDSVSIGNNTLADKANSVALGTNAVTDDAVATNNITINGTTHVFAGTTPGGVVSFGSKTRTGFSGVANFNRQLTNVSAGQIAADSLDAINGSQLYAVVDEVETNAKAIKKNKENLKDLAVGVDMLGDIVNDNTTAITNNTSRINGNTSAINTLGQKVTANTADIRSLEHVADNHEGRITTLENRSLGLANDINNKINNLGQRVNRLGASAAALANLHPMEFNADDKFSVSVGYGHYSGSNAVALGAYYRPNEKVLLGVSGTVGKENMFGATASFRFGKSSEYNLNHHGDIEKLKALVETLTAEVEALKASK